MHAEDSFFFWAFIFAGNPNLQIRGIKRPDSNEDHALHRANSYLPPSCGPHLTPARVREETGRGPFLFYFVFGFFSDFAMLFLFSFGSFSGFVGFCFFCFFPFSVLSIFQIRANFKFKQILNSRIFQY
jgi:hypothetical protein